jgi:LysM repeat protein
VTVQPGDTLWSIATRVAPQRDPRAEVAALQKRNHLADVALVPGQVLQIP